MLGVGALIFDQSDRILMVQRGGEPLRGWWSLPGGVLETGETLVDGIRREVREETGLNVEPVSAFEIFERIMRDDEGRAEYHYVLIDYICKLKDGALAAGDDCADVRWTDRDELPAMKITEGTLEVIERAYRSRQ